MTNKLATTKLRLSYYLKNKGIKIQNFLSSTGIKRGFLDSDKMEISVTDENLAKIFACYDDISPIWLITGNGPMLKEDSSKSELDEVSKNYKQIAEAQERLITSLEKQIERLEAELAKRDAQMGGDAGCAGADMSETA
jgi:uncharacterized small protein (DUF1192 family)